MWRHQYNTPLDIPCCIGYYMEWSSNQFGNWYIALMMCTKGRAQYMASSCGWDHWRRSMLGILSGIGASSSRIRWWNIMYSYWSGLNSWGSYWCRSRMHWLSDCASFPQDNYWHMPYCRICHSHMIYTDKHYSSRNMAADMVYKSAPNYYHNTEQDTLTNRCYCWTSTY